MECGLAVPLLVAAVGIVATLLGVLVSDFLARRRETRQRDADRRLLAGALASELKGFLALWDEVSPKDKPERDDIIITWAVEQSYFSVYDSAGARLYLLPPALVEEVIVCYFKLKRALDNLRMSQRITEYAQTFGRWLHGRLNRPAGQMALKASQGAVESGKRAVAEVKKLLPKLESIAGRQARASG